MKLSFSVKSAEVKVGEQVAVQATDIKTAYDIKGCSISAKNEAASVVINSTGKNANTAVSYEGASLNMEVGFGEVKELVSQARHFFDGYAKSKATASYASESKDSVSNYVAGATEPEAIPEWAVARILLDEDGDYAFECCETAAGERTGIAENLTAACYYRKEMLIGNIKEDDFATFAHKFDKGMDGYLSASDIDTLALYFNDLQDEDEKNPIF